MLHMAMKIIKKYMCVVTGLAIGFRTGYHHVKVNAENKNESPMPVVVEWLYMCARGFDNGAAATLI